jgi:hypothetical protein
LEHERVAQLVEHRPFKALVLGSSPSPLTTTLQPVKPPILCKTHQTRINTSEFIPKYFAQNYRSTRYN